MQINFDTNNEAVIKRSYEEAIYIITNNSTIRDTSEHFGVCSKTTHNDLTKVLTYHYPNLAKVVKKHLDSNKDNSVFRAGKASAYKAHLLSTEKKQGLT